MSVMELQSTFISSTTGILPSTGGQGDDATDKPIVRLREPRDLYSTTSLQHPPKWPVECQVIPEKIKHIETVPAKLEPFYVSSLSEPQPKPVGEEMGTVVYDYQPKLSVDYFCRSCVGGSDGLQTFESEPNTLKFESRFESGNLAKAIKVTNVYYELHLRQDMYTDRHSQWFYFRIQNTKDNLLYRFSIVNFNKPDSLYKYGLKILTYSEKEAQLNNVGWVRGGQNISYFRNDIPSEENGSLYTLTFNLKFRHSNDTIYLAHCYPYTYSTLQNYLRTIEEDSFKSQLLTIRLLCRSLAGNNVYVLTITSPDNDQEESQKKPAILLSARVHPGETQSSHMMNGIIDFLTSNCPQAQELRDRFIFKLIPMLNPDGVIVGNSRCCLLGQDLNRQYRTVLREAFPQIYHTKVMLRRLTEENGLFLYCDIHGHSRRNNVFIYGCENRKFPEKKLAEQVFPLMMHKNAADKFSFQNCKFRVQKTKEGTGRVFAWTLGVVNSYTLEISLGGSTMPSRQYTHFNTADYEAVGRHFCETLMDFSDPAPAKERLRDKILLKLMEGGSNADEPVNIPLTDYSRPKLCPISSLSHSETDSCDEEDGALAADGTKGNAASGSIKRQHSLRTPRSKKTKQFPQQVRGEQRPPLSLSKASVDFIRIGQKQRRIEETQSEILFNKELAVFKRLTKFRRKQRRTESIVITERELASFGSLSTPKCTSILFDDPFNPPGSYSRLKKSQRFEEDMDEEGCDHSGTEDECDECDRTITNKNYFQEGANNEDQLEEVTSEIGTLVLAPKAKISTKDSEGSAYRSRGNPPVIPVVTFAPFVPKLPQGKPLGTFYSVDTLNETSISSSVSKSVSTEELKKAITEKSKLQTFRRGSLTVTSTQERKTTQQNLKWYHSQFTSKGQKGHEGVASKGQIPKKLTTTGTATTATSRRVSWTETTAEYNRAINASTSTVMIANGGVSLGTYSSAITTTASQDKNWRTFKKSKSLTGENNKIDLGVPSTISSSNGNRLNVPNPPCRSFSFRQNVTISGSGDKAGISVGGSNELTRMTLQGHMGSPNSSSSSKKRKTNKLKRSKGKKASN